MFAVSIGGYNSKHTTLFLMSRPKGLDEYLLLIIKNKAEYAVNAISFVSQPDCALIIPPGIPYRYGSELCDYMDDWMHFSCTDPSFFQNLSLPFCTPIPLTNSANVSLYVQQIIWEANYTPKSFQTANVNLLMQVLFNNLALAWEEKDNPRPYSPYYSRLQNLRLSMIAQPYNIYLPEEIARSLQISVSYFQHLYTNFFGIAFQNDLIQMRVNYAKELLKSTNFTIAQVAELCGYNNEVHFYRQFKKYTKLTPTQYRDQFTATELF